MTLIIVLNGTSSSGKSTLARELQKAEEKALLDFSLDTVLYTLPARELARLMRGEELRDVAYESLVAAYFACVKELAKAGLSLIVECAITAARRAEQLVEAVSGNDVVMVGIDCPVDVLDVREKSRSDRRPGLARAQCDTIHRWLRYDVLVNTETASPEANVMTILKAAASDQRRGFSETVDRLSRHR